MLSNYSGTRDLLAADMRWRQQARDVIRKVLESFGYEPLETPELELGSVLRGKGGTEIDKQVFILRDPYNTEIGLRFDHTLPLARVVGMYGQTLPNPYRRYTDGNVFRAEKPQQGRFRVFEQFDFDTVGTSSVRIDAEVPVILFEVLYRLGISSVIGINDRRLMRGIQFAMKINSDDQMAFVLRQLDKIGKEGIPAVLEKLTKPGADEEQPWALDPDKASRLVGDLMSVQGLRKTEERVALCRKLFPSVSTDKALDVILELFELAMAMGAPEQAIEFDPLIVRGLGYYTGPVFEASSTVEGIGSIAAGGRFDKLIQTLSAGEVDAPACGASFGLDRIYEVGKQLGLVQETRGNTDALVILVGGESELVKAGFELATQLRTEGFRIENPLESDNTVGVGKQIGASITYAASKGTPFALIIGSQELEQGMVTVRSVSSAGDKVDDRDQASKNKSMKVERVLLPLKLRELLSDR